MVYDTSDPYNINVTSHIFSPNVSGNFSYAGAFDGNYAYNTAINEREIRVYDVNDPNNIFYLTSLQDNTLLWYGREIILSGNELYFVGKNSFSIIDIFFLCYLAFFHL